MNFRASLLSLVATPDRAWLTLLAGVLLLCREFLAPGRVVPGVVGGVGVILALWGLSSYRISLTGLALLLLALCSLWIAAHRPPWYLHGSVSALIAAGGAWYLVPPPWRISFAVAAATIPAVLLLSFLLSTSVRAVRNKVSQR